MHQYRKRHYFIHRRCQNPEYGRSIEQRHDLLFRSLGRPIMGNTYNNCIFYLSISRLAFIGVHIAVAAEGISGKGEEANKIWATLYRDAHLHFLRLCKFFISFLFRRPSLSKKRPSEAQTQGTPRLNSVGSSPLPPPSAAPVTYLAKQDICHRHDDNHVPHRRSNLLCP